MAFAGSRETCLRVELSGLLERVTPSEDLSARRFLLAGATGADGSRRREG